MKLDRRQFLGSSVGVAATAGVTAEWVWPKRTVSYRRPRSAVAVLNAAEFTEWTPDNHLRHSRFVAPREDKKARDVGRESD